MLAGRPAGMRERLAALRLTHLAGPGVLRATEPAFAARRRAYVAGRRVLPPESHRLAFGVERLLSRIRVLAAAVSDCNCG